LFTPVPPFAEGNIPVTPVVSGKPVTFVIVPLAGVPRVGVTKVGLVAKTTTPVPVGVEAKAVAIPVPKPVIPVLKGNPVVLVNTPLAGVPNAGVTKVGLVAKTTLPDPVGVAARAVAIPVPNPVIPVLKGKPVTLVKIPLEGVPRAGVTKVGLVAKTILPDPVTVLPKAVTVPLVGNVNAVVAVAVRVTEKAPTVAKVDELARVKVPVVVLTVNPLMVVPVIVPPVIATLLAVC
jgi:hypothetical protein